MNKFRNIQNSKIFYYILVGTWILSVVLAIVLTLQTMGGYIFFWERLSVSSSATRPGKQGAYIYIVPIGGGRFSHKDDLPSLAHLYENGQELGPGGALRVDIGSIGMGRFLYEKNKLFFSSSDNSDPRTNGRKYVLVLPFSLSPGGMAIAYVWVGCLTLGLLVTVRRTLPFVFDVFRDRMGPFFHSKRFFVPLAILWAVSLAAVLFLWLQGNGLSTRMRQQFPVAVQATQPSGHGPYSYSVSMGIERLSQTETFASPAVLLEDGHILGPGNISRTKIGAKGGGRFSFWKGDLIFSSSDNSDPRTNGRKYVLVLPFSLNPGEMAIAYVWVGCLTLGLLITEKRTLPFVYDVFIHRTLPFVFDFFIHPPFYLHALILILVFLITRLPFFLYYPVASIAPDTGGYIALVRDAESGVWPQFIMRTPGYPIFIWFITAFVDRWLAVIAVQNLLSLASALCLIYGVYRLRWSLVFPATLAMVGFLGSSQVMIYDITALSESLYTSCIIFSFAFLLLSFSRRKSLNFALPSAIMACVILVRPSGMFFLVIYVLVLVYLLRNHYTMPQIIGFLVPLPLILLSLCLYNYMTIQAFAISPWGVVNLAHSTILFWEPDESFPPDVNKILQKLPSALFEKAGFTEHDRQIMNTSWDFDRLTSTFTKGFTGFLYEYTLGKNFTNETEGQRYSSTRFVVRDISYMAIKKHPDLYLKFVLSNSSLYFKNITLRFEFYSGVLSYANMYYIQKKYSPYGVLGGYSYMAKEYADSLPPDAIQVVGSGENANIILTDTLLKSWHSVWQTFQWNVFQQNIWVWAYFVVFILSMLKLFLSKGRHLGAFILFILTISVFGASLVTSLVELAIERYAYPTQFIYYLSVALSPLLFSNLDMIKSL